MLIGALAGVLLGGIFYIYNRGKDAGKQEGVRQQLEDDKKQFQQLSDSYKAELDKWQQRDQQAQVLLQQAQVALDNANSRLAIIAQQRESDRKGVEALPDVALEADIKKRLAIRGADDVTAGFYPAELRKIDLVITDYPNLQAENTTLQDKLKATDTKIDALSQRVDAIGQQRDAAITYGNRVTELYVRAYNLAQKKHSAFVKILSFGLVHDRKLDLPNPTTLKP